MYVELHSRSVQLFSKELRFRGTDRGVREPGNASDALLDRDGVYGSPRFHLAAKKAGIKAHIGRSDGVRRFHYRRSLVVNVVSHAGGSSRAGYQNLCRLITKMKLRAGRKEGACASSSDLSEHAMV